MNPLTLLPLGSCLQVPIQVGRRYGGQICVECCQCRMLFVFEASAFKQDEDPVCFYCVLERKLAMRVHPEEVEKKSIEKVRISSSKQVKFKIGGHIFYPGCSDLPKIKSKIFRCKSCCGSVGVIRSGSVAMSKKPKVSRTLLCKNCGAKDGGYYSLLKRILGYSVENIISPLFWLFVNFFLSLF